MGNKVIASFEDQHGSHCVDVFARDDGTFGFEEFRSDADGAARWQSMARYSQQSFHSGGEALAEARHRVAWLGDVGPWRW